MRFGQLGEFVGGGLQVACIEGQVGLIVQFFVLAVVFSEHVFLSGRAGWKRRFAALPLYLYRCRMVFSDGQYGG